MAELPSIRKGMSAVVGAPVDNRTASSEASGVVQLMLLLLLVVAAVEEELVVEVVAVAELVH